MTNRAGVIPVAHSQDTIGPMARTVTDAALVLGALTGVDPRDTATNHRLSRQEGIDAVMTELKPDARLSIGPHWIDPKNI